MIEMLNRRDQHSFSTIYKLYKDKVFAFAFVQTKSKEIAEEIMQEVFLKLWEKRSELRVEHNFSGYIRKITFNKVNDHYRKEESNKRRCSDYSYLCETDRDETEDHYLAKELSGLYKEAVRLLPAQRKTVYILNKEYGLSYKEIAQKLGLSHLTVRNQLARSVKFLRHQLSSCCN